MTENFKETYKGGYEYFTVNDFVQIQEYNDEIKKLPTLVEKRKVICPYSPMYMNKTFFKNNQKEYKHQKIVDDTSLEIPYGWEKNPVLFYKNIRDYPNNREYYNSSDFTTINDTSKNNDFTTINEMEN